MRLCALHALLLAVPKKARASLLPGAALTSPGTQPLAAYLNSLRLALCRFNGPAAPEFLTLARRLLSPAPFTMTPTQSNHLAAGTS
jgi:hypothetical protein